MAENLAFNQMNTAALPSTTVTPSRTYARDERAWLTYQPFMPEEMRLSDEDQPTEEALAWRGLEVHLDRFPVPRAPATVIVLHGAGAYGRILAGAGKVVRDLGYEALMPDLPGFGLTRAKRFSYDDWVDLVADLAAIEQERTGRPVVLFGASVGGMLGWHAAAKAPKGTVSGVAATTLIDPREKSVRAAVSRLPGADLSMRAISRLGSALDRLPIPMPMVGAIDKVANDPDLARVFARDRIGGGNRVPLRFLRTWQNYVPARTPEQWDRGPVVLVHPGADRWTPTALSLSFFDRLPEPKRYVELPNCGHLPIEQPGAGVLRDELDRFVASVLR